jgi:hypothetical protein
MDRFAVARDIDLPYGAAFDDAPRAGDWCVMGGNLFSGMKKSLRIISFRDRRCPQENLTLPVG